MGLCMIIAVIASLCSVCIVATTELQPESEATSPSCPPGFVRHDNGSNCVCASWPYRIVKCDEDLKTASMRIDYCMTYDNETREITAGQCITGFFRRDSYRFYYSLPKEVSALDEHVCGPLYSKGMLCGECEDGFAAFPLSATECVSCSDGTSNSWIKFLAFVYLPITVSLLIIVVFGISLVSGPVGAFIFYSQATTGYFHFAFTEDIIKAQESTTTPYEVSTPTKVLDGIYSLSNLNFFNNFIPVFCLTKNLNRLEAISLEYASALYPFVFLVLLYACIQLHARDCRLIVCCWKPLHRIFVYFRRSVDPKTSFIDAFATLILLSYVRFLTVTSVLLLGSRVYNSRGENIGTPVFSYDANIPYFHKEHLPLALLAIVIFLTFVLIPPLLLLFYPTSFFQKCLTRCRMNSQALRTFIEIFNGHFKDGTKGTRDYRFFAGFYFILRIIALVISFTEVGFNNIAISAIMYSFMAFLFVLVQPYKKQINNVADAFIFTIMSTLYTLTLIQIVLLLFLDHRSEGLSLTVHILYSLPLLCLIIVIMCWVLNRKTNCIQRLRRYKALSCIFRDSAKVARQHFDDFTPDRLLNPKDYEEL